MRTREQHAKIVRWSEEDKCYIGTCPSVMGGGVHGDDEFSVYRELCEVVDEWVRLKRKQAAKTKTRSRARQSSRYKN